MSRIGGGGVRGVQSFLDPPSKNLPGHSYEISNLSSESSAQIQSIGTLFEQIGLRKGVCGHVQKSEAHALGCRPRVESSQWSSNSPQLTGLCQHEIVSGILKKWKYCGAVQASYGCLVGHVCMGVRITVFAP